MTKQQDNKINYLSLKARQAIGSKGFTKSIRFMNIKRYGEI